MGFNSGFKGLSCSGCESNRIPTTERAPYGKAEGHKDCNCLWNETNWCHYFIRILLDLYMFRAHRPIFRRVCAAVHTTNGCVNSCTNSPEDGSVGPKHVETEQYTNKIMTSVGFHSIRLKDAWYKKLKISGFLVFGPGGYQKTKYRGHLELC